MKRIIFTGGGTAGHVVPNIALMERLHAEGDWDIHYIGTAGMEKELVSAYPYVTYHEIEAGKLRRYMSRENLTDPFRVIRGIRQAKDHIRLIKPDVIFSKGGYVSVPVVVSAGKVPVVSHESDYTPGLANRIASRFTDTICVSFADTVGFVPGGKGVHTGSPIRPELYAGSRDRGLGFTGLDGKKPVLMVMGGSLGAQRMNELVRAALPGLLERFDVVHLCGRGKLDEACSDLPGYIQYEYIKEEMPDLYALADLMISRAGANSVFEILALHKPALLVPLTSASTRGDQLLNAQYFEKKGFAHWLDQNTADGAALLAAVDRIWAERDDLIRAMEAEPGADGTEAVLERIRAAAGHGQLKEGE